MANLARTMVHKKPRGWDRNVHSSPVDGSDSSLGLVRYLCAFSPDGVRHLMLNLEALVQSQIQAGVSSEVDLGPFFFLLIFIHLAVRGLS